MSNVDIDDLAAAVMDGLEEYVELADAEMKKAVRKTATQVKKRSPQMHRNAPASMRKAGQ